MEEIRLSSVNHQPAASHRKTLLMEEIRSPSVDHQPAASHRQTLLLEGSLYKMYALFCVNWKSKMATTILNFYTPVFRRAVLYDWVWRAGRRPHRFPHNNFSCVYRIFTKLGHMIPLWKWKNTIYFGVKGQGHRYYK